MPTTTPTVCMCGAWIVALLMLGACAAQPEEQQHSGALSASMSDAGSHALQRLGRADNGLELRRWLIQDDPQRIAAAIMSHSAGAPPLDPDQESRLVRNGFRLARVPEANLDALLGDLGGATLNLTAWHGQVYNWHELLRRPLPESGQALAIDGRVRRFDGGALGLVARAWTTPMEGGARLQLEILPQYQYPHRASLLPRLGEERERAESFMSIALHLPLESGYAYLLTGEAPDVDWASASLAARGGEERPSGGASAEGPGDPSHPGGPGGPEAAPPPTLGQLLLIGESQPRMRGVFVFIPQIPESMFPPAEPTVLPRAAR